MRYLLLLCMAFGLTACVATNPATGKQHFSFINEEQEYEEGHTVANKATQEFGGLYKEKPALNAYLADRLQEVVAVSERADKPFELRVFDDPIMNAFAIPGYTMISRGILPYFNSEAELMMVLGHEVGHVTAQHMVRSHATVTFINVGLVGMQAALASQGVSAPVQDVVNQLSQVIGYAGLAGFSRSYELEADMLGIRYISKLCYTPQAGAAMFHSMQAYQDMLDRYAKASGKNIQEEGLSRIFHSHPDNETRVTEAIEHEAAQTTCGNMWHRDRYLHMIDGLAFGPKVSEGFGANGRFYASEERYILPFPEGFVFPNIRGLPKAVNAERKVHFDTYSKRSEKGQDAEEFLIDKYPGVRRIEPVFIDGHAAYTGEVPSIEKMPAGKYRVVVVPRDEGKGEDEEKSAMMVVMIFGSSEDKFNTNDVLFKEIALGYQPLTLKEARKIEPLRLGLYTTKAGDTVASIASRLPFGEFQEEWLRLLNGMRPTDEVRAGTLLKIVVNPNKGAF